jgi:Flp pilus assembly pilin Flp
MFKTFLKDESGVEIAEYAVAAALIVAIAVVVYKALGDAIFNSNTETGADIQSATYESPGAGT